MKFVETIIKLGEAIAAVAGIAFGAVELRMRKSLFPAVRSGISTRWRTYPKSLNGIVHTCRTRLFASDPINTSNT